MSLPYTKAHTDGFVDEPSTTTPIEAAFLNDVEAALIALCGVAPSDQTVPVWNATTSRFEPALLADAQIADDAAIAKSKLASLAIVDADVDADAAIAKSKLASLAIVDADVDADAAIAKSKLAPLGIIAHAVNTEDVTVDSEAKLLTDGLTFTADGTSTYLVTVSAPSVYCTTGSDSSYSLYVGVETGTDLSLGACLQYKMALHEGPSDGSEDYPLFARARITPDSAGDKTINIFLESVSGDTFTVRASSAASGSPAETNSCILVTVEVLPA